MNDSEKSVTPVDEKFLNRGFLFALEYRQGRVYLEVDGWEFKQYKPLVLDSVTSQSAWGWSRLNEGNTQNNDDILFIEKGKLKVLHTAIGVYPRTLRMYVRYPEQTQVLGDIPNISGATAGDGDNWAYVDGDDTPYDTPSDVRELFIPSGEHLDFNFYNPDNRDRTPRLNIRMREYDVNVLDPTDPVDKRVIVNKIERTGSGVPISPVGSKNRKAEFELGDSWSVRPLGDNDLRQLENEVRGNGR